MPFAPSGMRNSKSQPFAITCPGAGTGRWLDPRTWAFDFSPGLPGGVRCTFTLVEGETALTGQFSAVTSLGAAGVLITGGYGRGSGPRAAAWVYRD